MLAMPLVGLAGRVMRESMPAEIARFVPGWDQLGADWRSLLFSVLVAVFAAFVFSAIPAWRAARLDLNTTLREGGRSVTEGGRRQVGRNILVVGQLTAALALLVTAGDAGRSARALIDGPQGYEPRGVLALRGDAVGRALLRGGPAARLHAYAPGQARGAARRDEASPPRTRCRAATATRRAGSRSRDSRSRRAPTRRRWRRASRRRTLRDASPAAAAGPLPRGGRQGGGARRGGREPVVRRALLARAGPARQALPHGGRRQGHAVARCRRRDRRRDPSVDHAEERADLLPAARAGADAVPDVRAAHERGSRRTGVRGEARARRRRSRPAGVPARAACRARSGSPRSACSTSPGSWWPSACWRWCSPSAASTG